MYFDPQKPNPALLQQLCEAHPDIAANIAAIESLYANTGVLAERQRLEQLRDFELQRLYSAATVRSNIGPTIQASNFTTRRLNGDEREKIREV
jgi:hypothetical protein